MGAKEYTLQVQRTARYFTLGEYHRGTSEIWFVLHGYAQLAKDFIVPFDVLDDGTRLIVAPEGLNRFYARGMGGQPAATWMTTEDRENEIRDYLNYLEDLYKAVTPPGFEGKICLLGFSQGVATASRWLHHSAGAFDRFILYAGEIASELRDPPSDKLFAPQITYVTGTKDRMIREEHKERVRRLMDLLNARIIEFEGGHEVKREALEKLKTDQS